MSWEPRLPCQSAASGRVGFMPRRETRHDNTGVDSNHLRVRSMVVRTMSSVNGGRSSSGTATGTPLLFLTVMGVATGSISIVPSRSLISTDCPPVNPRRSRMAFGTTSLPAESMVDLMVEIYHAKWRSLFVYMSVIYLIREGSLRLGAAAGCI